MKIYIEFKRDLDPDPDPSLRFRFCTALLFYLYFLGRLQEALIYSTNCEIKYFAAKKIALKNNFKKLTDSKLERTRAESEENFPKK